MAMQVQRVRDHVAAAQSWQTRAQHQVTVTIEVVAAATVSR
jgi:hypothetical protein